MSFSNMLAFCFLLTLAPLVLADTRLQLREVTTKTSSAPNTKMCLRPRSAPFVWDAETEPDDPFITIGGCLRNVEDDRYWTMLSAYRSGSSKSRWKYTDDIDDPECLQFWTYYSKKGDKVLGRFVRTTTQGDSSKRLWCPLPRTSKWGDEGKLWMYCNCTKS